MNDREEMFLLKMLNFLYSFNSLSLKVSPQENLKDTRCARKTPAKLKCSQLAFYVSFFFKTLQLRYVNINS